MSIFNRLLNQLLPNQPQEITSKTELLVREPIKHSKVFLKEYQEWMLNEMDHGLLLDLQEKRGKRKSKSAEAEGVNYYEVQNSTYSGFYFYGETNWSSLDYSYLVHLFIEKLKALDYVINHTVREVIESTEGLTGNEQYFLKPALKFRKQMPCNQLYGNIEIEHKLEDGETKMVKLMTSVYSDQHYKNPINFDALVEKLFLL